MDSNKQTIERMQNDIIELQIIYTHQENLIAKLDEVIREQFKQIELLQQQQKQLISQIEGLQPNKDKPTYEKPPHY